LQLPARIGKYELEEFLGGGMSHVYRARDTVIGRTVAVKILTEQGCADPDAKARFLQEARMAGNIQHDNVISIYDFGEDEQKRPFMVMEFLRGEDLRHAIKEGHTGDLQSKLRIAVQIARALGYIHTLKIVHRDIKPENIHVTPAGVVKLMDFGIAKTEGLSMTRTGYVMGTPYYMAPEQVLGKNITDSVDIYAFGVLFFELLAGVRLLSGDTVERIFYAILNEPLNLEPLTQAGVPQAVCSLIASCTAKDPAQRPPNFEAVVSEIERILGDGKKPAPVAAAPAAVPAPAAAPVPVAEPKAPAAAKPWMAIVSGVLLVAAVGVLIAVMLNRSRHAEPPVQTPGAAAEKPVVPAAAAVSLSYPSGDMELVPAGAFLAGKDLKPITLPAFYIDRTEVTNAAYQAFCKATGHALPKNFPADKPDHPVVNVTFEEAGRFAEWAHKRLPTPDEWEKAARGAKGWQFPWGDNLDLSLANVHNNKSLPKHELMPAVSFDAGVSPYRALNMVGNVWEFVNATDTPDADNRAFFSKQLKPPPRDDEPWHKIRGESFETDLTKEVLEDSGVVPARWEDHDLGFRCAQDPPK
jgi:formylglycine-generating enzyme required for sulfatase activity